MSAYYNEIDPYAAQWLRNLIAAGHIAPGIVDERSIEDVRPSDLRDFTQVHFFAGIGVWSRALRQAGWPDDRPVWTGSCPCQPFSAAGKGAGFDDQRHLWPHFFHLIKQRRPATVIGEQVASKDAEPWLDLVQADVEALGYAFGCVPFPSAGVGAPHIRDRLYWVANADGHGQLDGVNRAKRGGPTAVTEHSSHSGVVDTGKGQRGRRPNDGALLTHRKARGRHENTGDAERHRGAGGMGNPFGPRLEGHTGDVGAAGWQGPSRPAAAPGVPSGLAYTFGGLDNTGGARADKWAVESSDGAVQTEHGLPGPVNGFWRDADWLFCRDGKWRPVEPGTFPLAHGVTNRVGRLRAYGNAINAEAARVFIQCLM